MRSKRPANTQKTKNAGNKRPKSGLENTDHTTLDLSAPGTGSRPDAELTLSTSEPLDKTKREADTKAVVTTSMDEDEPTAAPAAPSKYRRLMVKGQFKNAGNAFRSLLGRPQVKQEEVEEWMAATFGDPDVAKQATKGAVLFARIIWTYRCMLTQLAVPDGADKHLVACLSALPSDGAVAVGAVFIRENWHQPELFDRNLRGWIVRNSDMVDTGSHPGLAARLLTMLWNAGDAATICTLIAAGVDTATPSYVDIKTKLTLEGLHNGYVEPIEHMLGSYLYLVDLLHPTGGPPPTLSELSQPIQEQLVYLGAQSPGDERDANQNLALGAAKVKAAADVLRALAARGDAKILTSYADVTKSELFAEFRKRPGTIWGFEHVRFPYVYAAHIEEFGKYPVRMWEMWAVVDAVLDEETYLRLLVNPADMISTLVETGVEAMEDVLEENPLEYMGVREPANRQRYLDSFAEQCRAYLEVLAGRAPAAKFATASIRGNYEGQYLGAFGCKAGLWWAQKQGMPVYYCLDGVRDDDVIQFKTRKTDILNDFLGNPGKRNQYVEVISLAEIREILLNWDTLQSVVRFSRMGTFLTGEQVNKLIAGMTEADDKAKKRLPPLRAQVLDAAAKDLVGGEHLPDLTAPPFRDLSEELFYRVVSQLLLLNLALPAESDQVLSAFLASKGAAILFETEILPRDFGRAYQQMVNEQDTGAKARLGVDLVTAVGDGGVPAPLDMALIATIKRFSGLE